MTIGQLARFPVTALKELPLQGTALGRSPDWQNPKRPYFSTLSHIDSGKERMLSATQAFKRLRVSK